MLEISCFAISMRFFRESPQQHVSSLRSIEMAGSRFERAYIELTLIYIVALRISAALMLQYWQMKLELFCFLCKMCYLCVVNL